MNYYTYIQYSASRDQYYTGHTGTKPEIRVERHNQGWTKSTKAGIPWELKYIRIFDTKSEAIKWERYIKSRKSREFIEHLIESQENELSDRDPG